MKYIAVVAVLMACSCTYKLAEHDLCYWSITIYQNGKEVETSRTFNIRNKEAAEKNLTQKLESISGKKGYSFVLSSCSNEVPKDMEKTMASAKEKGMPLAYSEKHTAGPYILSTVGNSKFIFILVLADGKDSGYGQFTDISDLSKALLRDCEVMTQAAIECKGE